MSTLKSPALARHETAFEIDMRNLLRSKRARVSNESEERDVEFSSLISQISSLSVHEIDHLIEGLQGLREKLDDDGDRIQRDIGEYATFSRSVVDLTKIVSEGITLINMGPTKASEDGGVALPRVNSAELSPR